MQTLSNTQQQLLSVFDRLSADEQQRVLAVATVDSDMLRVSSIMVGIW